MNDLAFLAIICLSSIVILLVGGIIMLLQEVKIERHYKEKYKEELINLSNKIIAHDTKHLF